jgi:hypothetical protein
MVKGRFRPGRDYGLHMSQQQLSGTVPLGA